MEHKILRFTEIRWITPHGSSIEEEYSRFVQEVSTRHIRKFEEEYDTEYGYVKHLIERALDGSYHQSTSKKYSFSDCDDWYLALRPFRDCDDPVVEITVDIW